MIGILLQLNGSKCILGPESPEVMDWSRAKDWCQSVGGELPSRDILLQAYMNNDIRKEFTDTYFWSSTEFATNTAWCQDFIIGHQDVNDKTTAYYVRAVKKIVI